MDSWASSNRYLVPLSHSVSTHVPSLMTPYLPLFGKTQSHFGFSPDLSKKKYTIEAASIANSKPSITSFDRFAIERTFYKYKLSIQGRGIFHG